ncbi:hypothetical protein P280DRAFT_172562 [Massarina eburnea CBS 473.64]|uniref:Uncharacterized protein n=1 Tax=Massarina eburnea CBS 473.64 TaxID=1395130 RepID=A0A6A6S9R9_9PLEO|nr:hypothetical protein P280DRAFT_172562 [Massarina eburnea CBS 473.64]
MPHSTWKETRPGRWERPLSSLEKFNLINRNVEKALDRDNWVKTAVTKLEFDPKLGDPVEALKNAWKQVRWSYPEIAAFPYNGQYIYRTGTPEQVALWVSATFVVEEDLSVDDVFGHIPRNEQMMCYYFRRTSEVMIRSPHYRLDARGAVFCLDLLVRSLTNEEPELKWGACAKNLSPTVDKELDIPYEYTPEIQEFAEARLATLKPRHPLIGLTPSARSCLPGATKRRMFKYTKGEMCVLGAGMASNGWSITDTLQAAVITACTRLSPPTQNMSYIASFHSDLRHLIPENSRTKNAPIVSTSVINTEIIVTPTTKLKEHHEQLGPVYQAGYAPYVESTACYLEKLATSQYPNGREPFGSEAAGELQPRLSSLGVVEDKILVKKIDGVVEVKDFWLGVETLTKKMMVHTWIFEGEGVFSVSYNESFWDDEYVADFVEAMKSSLLEVSLIDSRKQSWIGN